MHRYKSPNLSNKMLLYPFWRIWRRYFFFGFIFFFKHMLYSVHVWVCRHVCWGAVSPSLFNLILWGRVSVNPRIQCCASSVASLFMGFHLSTVWGFSDRWSISVRIVPVDLNTGPLTRRAKPLTNTSSLKVPYYSNPLISIISMEKY